MVLTSLNLYAVAPRGGAWIETRLLCFRNHNGIVAPRGGAWIETENLPEKVSGLAVAPRGGAWIETRRHLGNGP